MFILAFHTWQCHQKNVVLTFFSFFFSYFPLKKQGSLKNHDQKNISTTRTTESAHTIKVDNTVHLRLVLTLPKEK